MKTFDSKNVPHVSRCHAYSRQEETLVNEKPNKAAQRLVSARLRPLRLRSTVALCTRACVEIWEEVCSGVQSGTSSWLMVRKRPRPHLMVGRRLTPCVHTLALRR